MFKLRGVDSLARSRWAAIGAAVAVALGAGGAGWIAHAAPVQPTSAFVSITPCRLVDTRASDQVGDRATPLQSAETWVRQVWGTNGHCVIPTNATSISYNLTIPDPTVTGFVTLYPADAALPLSSSINPVANGGTKGNSGVVGLSATGAMNVYNYVGPINIVMDVTGYYVPGGAGAPGPRGFSAWDTIPSGVTVTGEIDYDGHASTATLTPPANPPASEDNVTDSFVVNLPGLTPVPLTDAAVAFGASPFAPVSETDLTCGGDISAPTAPPGMVCIYMDISSGVNTSSLRASFNDLASRAFFVTWTPSGFDNADEFIYATWAYTAP